MLRWCREIGIRAAFEEVRRRSEGLPAEAASERERTLRMRAVSLFERYQATGARDDLDSAVRCWQDAVEITSPSSPIYPFMLNLLAIALKARYGLTNQLGDLGAAVDAHRGAVGACPRGSEHRAGLMKNLGVTLMERHEATGSRADLDEAVVVYRGAVDAAGEGSDGLLGLLDHLFTALGKRFVLLADSADLDAAIEVVRREASLATPSSHAYLTSRMELGVCLVDRFARQGDVRDLDAAVEVVGEAVTASPPGHPQLPALLQVLGNAHSRRYEHAHQIADLNASIVRYKEAVEATPAGSPERPTYLYNWGKALEARYERTGGLADLDDAIAAFRRAAEPVQAGSPGRFLAALAFSLRSRYSNTHRGEDLDEAMRLVPQMREAPSTSWEERAERLAERAGGLGAKFSQDGDLSDLSKAIELYREARDLAPASSFAQLGLSANLGGSLLKRYERTHNRDDLDEAIGLFEEAARRGKGTLELPNILNGLAMGLRRRYERDGDRGDLTSAVAQFRQSCRLGLKSAPRAVLAAGTWWGSWAADRGAWQEAAEAYGSGLDAAQRLVGRQSARREKQTWLSLAKGLGSGLAYALTMTGAREEAVTALERGRAVLLAEALEQGAVTTVSFDVIAAAAKPAPLVYFAAAAPGGIALIVGTDGGVTDVPLAGLTDQALRDKAREYVKVYYERYDRDTGYAAWEAALAEVGQWLWRHVMGAVLEAVAGAAEVVLIPTGLLGELPLHAAWTVDPAAPTGRRYALDEARISYSANARALAAARRAAVQATADSILIVEQPLPLAFDLAPLSHAEEEAAAVARAFAGSRPLGETPRITWLRHGDATHEAVKAELARHAVLHLCCHGWFFPLESMPGCVLMLADGGILTAGHTAERQGGPARLAVLSGCETSMAGMDLPDEVMGLPTGLVEGGVAGVVGSLWSAREQSTAVLVTRFYELMFVDGLTPSEALRRAQRWVRDATNEEITARFPALTGAPAGGDRARQVWGAARPYRHPKFWAAFAYTGA
ncbi:MAG: CHAT domain-containing protein [Egibacteraceae bacterium]